MIRFAIRPDKTFTKVVTVALEEAIEGLEVDISLNFVNFSDNYFSKKLIKAYGGGISGVKLIKSILEKLLRAHKATEVYQITDRHFQLIDRILYNFCECYGDFVHDMLEDPKCKDNIITYKGKPILKLDSGLLIDCYFWDMDYDTPKDIAIAMTRPENSHMKMLTDTSSVAIAASLNHLVDASDLVIKKVETPSDWVGDDAEDEESLDCIWLGIVAEE